MIYIELVLVTGQAFEGLAVTEHGAQPLVSYSDLGHQHNYLDGADADIANVLVSEKTGSGS